MNVKGKKLNIYDKKSKKKFNKHKKPDTYMSKSSDTLEKVISFVPEDGQSFDRKNKKPKKKFNKKKKPQKVANISLEINNESSVKTPNSILKKTKKSDESFGTHVQTEKKSLKRKNDDVDEGSLEKKIKQCEMKFKDRKLMRKQKDEKFDVVKNLKKMWEECRREDCQAERKTELLQKLCNVMKGRVKEFAFAHDTVRILECVIMEGTEEHRSLLFEPLKDDVILMSKSKYAKFFLLKMLKYGSKKQKEVIMKAFHGSVTKLMRHTEAAEVVEMAFNECANALQRFQMVQEFYGASYRIFKETNIHNLAELLEKKPESKTAVISSMKEELVKVLGKSVIKHSLVHHVLLQFFLNCDPASRSAIIESLNEVVPEILHTKDGSRVAMHCIWHGTNKDRKVIIKHMKTFVKKIAMEEHGHMVLLALFDCVDDTRVVEKVIIKELQESLLEISQNIHGKKVLVYLLNPRDPHFCHPDIINILKAGSDNSISKKDPEIRHQELKVVIAKPLTDLIVNHIADLYKNNAFCLFTVTTLKHTVGNRREAFEAISKLAAEPYTSENKNVHIIEHTGSFCMLKQLIASDASVPAEENADSVTFSQVLVDTVPDGFIKTWFQCNRGAFLLVNLLETEIPGVVKRVKEELTGCKKHILKLSFKGAEILLKKLKD